MLRVTCCVRGALVFGSLLILLATAPASLAAISANRNSYGYDIYTAPGHITGHPGIPFYFDELTGSQAAFSHNESTGTLTSTDPSYKFSQSLVNNVTENLGADGTYSLTLHEENNFNGTQATATAYANLISQDFAGKVPTSSFFQFFKLTSDLPQLYRIQGSGSQTGISPIDQILVYDNGSNIAAFGGSSYDQTLTLLPGHTYQVQVQAGAANDAFTGRNDGITSVSLDMNVTMTPLALPEPTATTLLGVSSMALLRRRSRQ